MGIQEDLNSFIHKYSITKGKPYTNTRIGHPKKSLFIGFGVNTPTLSI